MNCQRIQDSFLDFEANALPLREMDEVRAHLNTCPACQREWSLFSETLHKLDEMPAEAPSERLRTQFYAMLDTHVREGESAHPFSWSRSRLDRWVERLWPQRPVWQLATSFALLAVGLLIGTQLWSKAPSAPSATAAQLAATQRELAELRSQVESVNQLVNYSLASQQPAQARLQHVVSALKQNGGDDKQLAQLLNTLAFDPSTNVRLSALEALYTHGDQRPIQQGVIAALGREPSPLVQVAMIDFLTSVRAPDAAVAFQELARTPAANETVRSAAQRALALL